MTGIELALLLALIWTPWLVPSFYGAKAVFSGLFNWIFDMLDRTPPMDMTTRIAMATHNGEVCPGCFYWFYHPRHFAARGRSDE